MVTGIYQRRVAWGETDAAGIVFYPNYYRWFDDATHELFRHLGRPVPSMLDEGFAIPLVESQARFLLPLYYDDLLAIQSTVEEVRTRAFRVVHRVRRGTELVAEGYEVRIWIRLGPHREPLTAQSIPPDLRELLLR